MFRFNNTPLFPLFARFRDPQRRAEIDAKLEAPGKIRSKIRRQCFAPPQVTKLVSKIKEGPEMMKRPPNMIAKRIRITSQKKKRKVLRRSKRKIEMMVLLISNNMNS